MSYHDTVTKLQAPGSDAAGPFDRVEWFSLLERHGARPLMTLGEDGETTVAFPLERNGGSLRSLRHLFAFSWQPLSSADVSEPMLEAIARDLRHQTFRVDLENLPEESGIAGRLERAFKRAGWIVRLEPRDENHVLFLQGRSFSDYWASRPGPLRTTVKRKAKKVEIEITETFTDESWNEFQLVYARSWKTDETDDQLLADFAEMEGRAGRLRLGIARHDGEPVAAQFWAVDGGTAYIHKLAYDERHRNLSAGTILSAALFEHVIDVDKVEMIDFGTGADGYKRDWMEDVRIRYHLTCIDPRQPRGLWFLARKALARLARPLHRG